MDNTLSLKHTQSHYPMVDIFKLICALLVVLIHCTEIRYGHFLAAGIVDIFSGQAVPFFMIVSGFFLGKKLYKTEAPLRTALHSAKNWLLIYLAWTVLWTPYFISIYSERYPDKSILFLAAMLIRRYFFAGQGVYWYILVLAETSFLLGICVRYKKEKLFYAAGILGLLLGFIYDVQLTLPGVEKLNHLFYTVFSWSNNFIMKGIPYVAIGYFISAHSDIVDRFKAKITVVIYSAIAILTFMIYDGTPNRLYISYTIQAVLLFIIALQIKVPTISDRVTTHCRNMSTVLYYLHTLIIYFIIDPLFTIDAPIPLKFCISVISCALLYALAVKANWKPLNWILSIRLPRVARKGS